MNSRLEAVTPMAGFGKRFASEGYILPKPLFPVQDKPNFHIAITSIEEILNQVDLHVVMRKEMET